MSRLTDGGKKIEFSGSASDSHGVIAERL